MLLTELILYWVCFCSMSTEFFKSDFWTQFNWIIVCGHPVLEELVHGTDVDFSTSVLKSSPKYILFT